MTLYCPYHATCPFYKNWAKETGQKRKDVIIPRIIGNEDKIIEYDCLAILSVQNSDRTIKIGKELSDSLPNVDAGACSHLSLLNMLSSGQKLRE